MEWAYASRSLQDAPHNGDQKLIFEQEEYALVGLVDGLGHGEAAQRAANMAVDALIHYHTPALALRLQHCHAVLRHTRGVCVAIAVIDRQDNMLAWTGVGDVEAVLIRKRGSERHTLPRNPGVLGLTQINETSFRVKTEPLTSGDLLAFATDGIHKSYAIHLSNEVTNLQMAANQTLQAYNKTTDDASVLLVRIP